LEQSAAVCIGLYQKAEQLYQGGFLPKCAAVEWASVLNVRYQGMYLDCVRAIYELMSEVEAYSALQAVLDRAVRRLPFEEDAHIMRITCLMEQKRFHQAIEVIKPSRRLMKFLSCFSMNWA